mmetsp:Transcript_59851/g.177386  ORF Transcript_59851/g.177386 Transcript_59851/m.177386 type:complete len:102 (+) Transcript_59851:1092-1397(+)
MRMHLLLRTTVLTVSLPGVIFSNLWMDQSLQNDVSLKYDLSVQVIGFVHYHVKLSFHSVQLARIWVYAPSKLISEYSAHHAHTAVADYLGPSRLCIWDAFS